MRYAPSLPLLQRLRTLRSAWAWLLVGAVLLKAAVPLLAATAAVQQGAAMADVCSVYGVRTALPGAVTTAPVASDSSPDPTHADAHCALAPLLGASSLLAALPPADLKPASVTALTPLERVRPTPPDASQRWLVHRLHAPPPRSA